MSCCLVYLLLILYLLIKILLRSDAVNIEQPGTAARGGKAICAGAPEAHVRARTGAAAPEAVSRETELPQRRQVLFPLPQCSAALETVG